jgi:hypothetical protein
MQAKWTGRTWGRNETKTVQYSNEKKRQAGEGKRHDKSSLGRYVFGSEISYNKPPPACLG